MGRNYTRVKGGHNPGKWAYRNKQNSGCMLMLVLIIGLFASLSFISCENNEEDEDLTQPSVPTLQISDICGIWVDSSNSLYYIAIYPSGKYTYCFNNRLIGSGRCSLSDNSLYLNDEYTYASDVVTINKSNNKLILYGSVTNTDFSKEYISGQFIYSSESLSPSIVGARSTSTGGLNQYYDNLYKEISFISDVIFQYVYTGRNKSTLQYKTIAQYTWRYVYRKPYTYGVKLNNGDNVVEIYDFPFVYTPGWGALNLNLDDFIVEQ